MTKAIDLYVGLDDSNHAGYKLGEVDVAVFSLIPEDGKTKLSRRRDFSALFKWLNVSEKRDFRYCVLEGERFRHIYSNLPAVAPYIIDNFLATFRRQLRDISIYIDGVVKPEDEERIREHFRSRFPNLTLEHFKKPKKKVHKCPVVLFRADALANYLYRQEIESPNKILLPDEFKNE